jgi:hypothetical protein
MKEDGDERIKKEWEEWGTISPTIFFTARK